MSQGYLGRPALTAERFVADPADPTRRLYRTGDLVQQLPDGNLAYIERLDTQVKVHGQRIELGEIEAVLGQHPAVAGAAVVLHTAAVGEPQLIGYVVARAARPQPRELRRFLAQRLPAYMLPHQLRLLTALPLTPNGKVDRAALRALAPARRPARRRWARSLRELLVQSWAETLGITEVAADDDFFEQGGNSLRAAQLTARLAAALRIELPVATLLEHRTFADFAAVAEQTVARQR